MVLAAGCSLDPSGLTPAPLSAPGAGSPAVTGTLGLKEGLTLVVPRVGAAPSVEGFEPLVDGSEDPSVEDSPPSYLFLPGV